MSHITELDSLYIGEGCFCYPLGSSRRSNWGNLHGNLGNWNPTEKNCFLTTYHPSFMVHWWVLVHFVRNKVNWRVSSGGTQDIEPWWTRQSVLRLKINIDILRPLFYIGSIEGLGLRSLLHSIRCFYLKGWRPPQNYVGFNSSHLLRNVHEKTFLFWFGANFHQLTTFSPNDKQFSVFFGF